MDAETRETLLPFVEGVATDTCGCQYERYGHQEMNVAGTRDYPIITHVKVTRCPAHAAATGTSVDVEALRERIHKVMVQWINRWVGTYPPATARNMATDEVIAILAAAPAPRAAADVAESAAALKVWLIDEMEKRAGPDAGYVAALEQAALSARNVLGSLALEPNVSVGAIEGAKSLYSALVQRLDAALAAKEAPRDQ